MIDFPSVLLGRLWHTTSLDRYRGIRRAGAILVNPPSIPESERWGTGNGRKNYPYARWLGGVSLFDFRDFDPESSTEEYLPSKLRAFVPYTPYWPGRDYTGPSVWIEIHPERLGEQLISGAALLERAKADPNSVHHNYMPGIEAAYIGDLSATHFGEVFITSPADPTMRTFSEDEQSASDAGSIKESGPIEPARLSDAELEEQIKLLNQQLEADAGKEPPTS